MKTKIYLSVLLMFTIVVSQAQSIPNAGFENWTNKGSYSNPNFWMCFNDLTASKSVFTCEQGTPGDPGTYYLKLTSKTVAGMGVVPGMAVSGTFNTTTLQPLTGFAFNQRPLRLTGNWQYMIFGSSPGYIKVQLTRWDTSLHKRTSIASVDTILPGMVMSWGSFSIPLVYTDKKNNPDSCIITLSASGSSPSNSDYLYIDNLAFSDSLSGIANLAFTKTISAYPNPASDKLFIEVPQSTKESTLTLYNINGQELLRQQIYTDKTELNISNFTMGVYLLKYTTPQSSNVIKIIKE